jgi:hypothetical protein
MPHENQTPSATTITTNYPFPFHFQCVWQFGFVVEYLTLPRSTRLPFIALIMR